MVVPLGSHLGEMSDAQHLAMFSQRAQFLPDNLGDAPADANVNLVVDTAGRTGIFGNSELYGQADARQFAAGRGTLERCNGQIRSRLQLKVHAFVAVLAAFPCRFIMQRHTK